jgi:hypothetical protein
MMTKKSNVFCVVMTCTSERAWCLCPQGKPSMKLGRKNEQWKNQWKNDQFANESKENGTSLGPAEWRGVVCISSGEAVKTGVRGTGTHQGAPNSQGRLEISCHKGHALKAAVYTGQTTWRVILQETYEEDLLHFFRKMIRGSHDLLKQKPSSLLMLLGWSSISMVQYMCQNW